MLTDADELLEYFHNRKQKFRYDMNASQTIEIYCFDNKCYFIQNCHLILAQLSAILCSVNSVNCVVVAKNEYNLYFCLLFFNKIFVEKHQCSIMFDPLVIFLETSPSLPDHQLFLVRPHFYMSLSNLH